MSHRATGTPLYKASGSTSWPVPVPAGLTALDVVVVSVFSGSTSTFTPPAGFTSKAILTFQQTFAGHLRIYWKRVADATEAAADLAAGTYSFTSNTSQAGAAVAVAFAGRITTGDPFEGFDSGESGTTGFQSSTPAGVDVTPTTAACDLYAAATSSTSTTTSWTPPTGMTERYDRGVASAWLGVFTQDAAAAGPYGFTATIVGTGNNFPKMFAGALTPAVIVAPGPPTSVAVTAYPLWLHLGWGAPASGGSVSFYEVRIDGGDGVNVGTDLFYDVTGLTVSTAYDLEVRAHGPGGESAWVLVVGTTTALTGDYPSDLTQCSPQQWRGVHPDLPWGGVSPLIRWRDLRLAGNPNPTHPDTI